MKLSASKAAKLAGKSIPTITDALKSGRLSGTKLSSGGYEIEVSELERVYGPLKVDGKTTPQNLGNTTPKTDGTLRAESKALHERIAQLETERERERQQWADQVADLRARLDQEGEERRKLMAILTDQRPSPLSPVEAPPPGPQETHTGGFRDWLARVVAGR